MAKRQPTRTLTIEGEKITIPKLSRGRQLQQPQKIQVAKAVCKLYETDLYDLANCLKACGINSTSTWHKWRQENDEIEKLYLEAQQLKSENYRHRLKERALTMAERLIEGYTVTLIDETFQEITAADLAEDERQAGGDPARRLIRPVTVTKKRIFVRPSVRLIEQMIYNLDPMNFQRNPLPIEKQAQVVDIPVISWVDEDQPDPDPEIPAAAGEND